MKRYKKLLLSFLMVSLCSLSLYGAHGTTEFVTTWTTTTNGESITIPTTGGGYNYTIDCGDDGVVDATTQAGNYTCTFATAGDHKVVISGAFPHFYLNGSADAPKLKEVNQWGDIVWDSFSNAFKGATNLNITATDSPNLSNVTSMSYMFRDATSFNQDISAWDVSNVTSMMYMFRDATAFNQDISAWNVSNVTDMYGMFLSATSFDQNISGWNVSNVTRMSSMFSYATAFNGNISDWNVSNVTSMSYMFSGATDFNQSLSNWNVSNVTGMSNMFSYATAFDGNISDWNVSNVTSMSNMFYLAKDFNQDISAWNVSSVTNMSYMFFQVNSFNQDLSAWDVSNVTNMSNMFYEAKDFNQDLSAWDVSNVTNMSNMFFVAKDFNQDISDWNVSSVTSMSYMFGGATSFDQNISDWNVSNVTNMSSMFGGATSFDGNISDWNVSNVTDMNRIFASTNFNQDISTWDVSSVTNMYGMFHQAYDFNQSISDWNVSSVTDMSYMFYRAYDFNQNISDWNVSSVTNMYRMFMSANNFNQDISDWNVSSVTKMNNMLMTNSFSIINYDLLLSKWSKLTLQEDVIFHASSKYSADSTASEGRLKIETDFKWTITDNGQFINNAPTSSNISVTINEDNSKTFATNDFSFSDIDTGDSLDSIYITTLQTEGALKLSDANVTLNQKIAVGDIPNLVFTPVANANGTPYATFGFKVNDGDANSTSEYTATINVNAVDDIPIILSIPITTADEDSIYVYNLAGSDEDGEALSWSIKSGTTLPSWLSLITKTASWNAVGTSFSAGIVTSTSLAFDSDDNPYFVYQDSINASKATLMKYNGTSWSAVGGVGFSAGSVSNTSLAFDSNDNPYVVYEDYANGQKATLMKYNGTSWEAIGGAGFSEGVVYTPSIAFDSNNNPYVVYQDGANGDKTTLMKYDGTSWEAVGGAGFSAGSISSPSLTIDSNDNPYVVYQDGANGDKTTLMKYDGTSWEAVGGAGFSAGSISSPSLAIDSNDNPYVAYSDGSNNGKATLMKYNGTSWEAVGGAGFSAGSVTFPSLTIDSNDNPYVAYTDGSNGNKATLMKYDGTSWEVVGSTGFSPGFANTLSLAFDSSYNPYVISVNAYSSYNATLMKFSSSRLIGTPTNDDVGVHDVNITISDGTTDVEHNFQITVANVNDAPTSSNISVTINEDSSKTFAASEFSFNDVDVGDSLDSIYITTLQSAGSLTLSDTNVTLNQNIPVANIPKLKFTPVANANGTTYATFGFKVNDGDANSTFAYTATINVTAVEDAPTLEVIAKQTQSEDFGDLNITLTSNDADGDIVTHTVGSSNESIATVSIVDGKIVATSIANKNGVITVEVNATSNGQTVTQSFDLNITAVDDTPVLNTITNPLTKDEDFSDFNITLGSIDIENDSVTYAAKSNDTSKVTVSVSGSTLTILSVANYNGSASIDVNVTQDTNSSLYDTQTITFDINSVNDTPTIDTAFDDISILEDAGITNYELNVSDIDGDDLNISVESNNTAILTVTPNWSGLLNQASWTQTQDFNLTTQTDANGMVKITITVDDGESNSTRSFDVNVTAVNDKPIIDSVSTQLKPEDFTPYTIELNATDIDSSSLVYGAISNDTTKATIELNVTTLTITPVDNANGIVSIDINVTDGELSDTKSFDINIGPVDDALIFATLLDVTQKEDGIGLIVDLNESDIDDTLNPTYSVSSSDDTVAIVKVVDGKLVVIPVSNAYGEITVDVNVTNNGKTVSKSFTYTLQSVNDAPIIHAIDDITFDQNSTNTITKSLVIDISDDSSSIEINATSSISELIEDISIIDNNITNATLNYTVKANATGYSIITVKAKDSEGLSTTESFKVTVRPNNDNLCANDVQAALVFDNIKGENKSPIYVDKDLSLIYDLNHICAASISWDSSDKSVVAIDGTITRDAQKDVTVSVIATITKGDFNATKSFLMTVPQVGLSVVKSIEKAKDNLTFESIRLDNLRREQILSNLELPTVGNAETIITWSSSPDEININPFNGFVTRDANIDKNVTLTATISKDSVESNKTFNLIVKRIPANDNDIVVKDYEWLNYSVLLDTNRDNRNIKNNLTKPLPTTAPNGSTISWETTGDSIITIEGDVIRDELEDKFVTLKATITKGSTSIIKTFIFKVIEKVPTSTIGDNPDIVFKKAEESNEDANASKTITVSLSEDNVDVNTTLSLDKNIKSDAETLITQDSVKNILSLKDKIVTIFLNNDGSTETKSEFTNDDNETVISQVNITSANTDTTVDENGSIESNLDVDENTTLSAKIAEDGSVSHVMETKDANNTTTTTATSKLAGSEVIFENEKLTTSFTKTTTNNGGDTVVVEAIVETATNGTSTTRFQTRNLTTGETAQIESTMTEDTPFEAGNNVEIADIEGTLYIKINTSIDNQLEVE